MCAAPDVSVAVLLTVVTFSRVCMASADVRSGVVKIR